MNAVLSGATHSTTRHSISTDPGFAVDTDLTTCSVIPEGTFGDIWWAAKVENEQFVSAVEVASSRVYSGNFLITIR